MGISSEEIKKGEKMSTLERDLKDNFYYTFFGYERRQPTDTFYLFLIFKIGRFAVRYTTKSNIGIGLAVGNIGMPHIRLQIYLLSIYFRLEGK